MNMKNKNIKDTSPVSDIVNIFLANWYWFVISIVVCILLAFYYERSTPQIYRRTASVFIKVAAKGMQMPTAATAISEVDVLKTVSSVDNEILIFKSKRLMEEVVRRLKLDISYKGHGRLRYWEMYNQSPVIAEFPGDTDFKNFSFIVTPLNEMEVSLSHFKGNIISAVDEDYTVTAQFNDTTKTPIGNVVITPSINYDESWYNREFTIVKSGVEAVALACKSGLIAEPAGGLSSVVNLTINDVSPKRAEDILNTLIEVYNEDAVNDKNRVAESTSDFINERLILIEQELGGVDSQIADFKSENRLTDISSEAGVYMSSLNTYQQEILGLQTQKELSSYIKEYISDSRNRAELIPSNTGITDANLEGQIQSYNQLMLERNKLIDNSGSRNPVLLEINASLSSMQQTIIRTLDNFIAGLELKISSLRSAEYRTQKRIASVPSQQKYVLSVERQQKIKESLYLFLLNKREENALSKAVTEDNARVIDPAMGSNTPIAPNSKVIMLAGLVMGVFLPACILWLIVLLDNRVKGKKDIEALSIPLLAEIPQYHRNESERNRLVVINPESNNYISEAFRIMRANMQFIKKGNEDPRVIMFTSLFPGAGKTFVSSNFAVSLAMSGMRVVILDLDIRLGTLSGHLGKKSKGITDYLVSDSDDLSEIIHRSESSKNLYYISRGTVPPNPSELLLSDRLDYLIKLLRKAYDYIIIDSVPSNVIADAIIANRVADATMYVIRANKLDKRYLPDIEELYENDKLRNMHIILNGTKHTDRRYGGYYGYYGYYSSGNSNRSLLKRIIRKRK